MKYCNAFSCFGPGGLKCDGLSLGFCCAFLPAGFSDLEPPALVKESLKPVDATFIPLHPFWMEGSHETQTRPGNCLADVLCQIRSIWFSSGCFGARTANGG